VCEVACRALESEGSLKLRSVRMKELAEAVRAITAVSELHCSCSILMRLHVLHCHRIYCIFKTLDAPPSHLPCTFSVALTY